MGDSWGLITQMNEGNNITIPIIVDQNGIR